MKNNDVPKQSEYDPQKEMVYDLKFLRRELEALREYVDTKLLVYGEADIDE